MARRLGALLLLTAATVATSAIRASAHPHVWVEATAEIIFRDGKVEGVRHAWTFDDMYSAFVTQGVGKNPAAPTEDELKPIAKSNMESLAEFEYFTVMKAEGAKTDFAPPVDLRWPEYVTTPRGEEWCMPTPHAGTGAGEAL